MWQHIVVVMAMLIFLSAQTAVGQLSVPDTVYFPDCKAVSGGSRLTYPAVVRFVNTSATDTVYLTNTKVARSRTPLITNFEFTYLGTPFLGHPPLIVLPNDSLRITYTFGTGDVNALPTVPMSISTILLFEYRIGLTGEKRESDSVHVVAKVTSGEGEVIIPRNWYYQDVRGCSQEESPFTGWIYSQFVNGTAQAIRIDSITVEGAKEHTFLQLTTPPGPNGVIWPPTPFPYVVEPRQEVRAEFDVFYRDNAVVRSDILYHCSIGDSAVIYRSVAESGFRTFPEPGRFFLYMLSPYIPLRLGQVETVNQFGLQLCTPGEWTVDSFVVDNVWLPGEIQLSSTNFAIPSFLDGDEIYAVRVQFNPQRVGRTKGIIAMYCTAPNGVQRRLWMQLETDVTGNPNSVEDVVTDKGITIYPIPADERIHITVPSDIGVENLPYRLISGLGLEVRRGTITTGNQWIEVSALSSGVYFLLIETAKGTTVHRCLIRH